MPSTVGEKLRVQFRKFLRRGYARNAQLDRAEKQPMLQWR
jgi:hypothetical protein